VKEAGEGAVNKKYFADMFGLFKVRTYTFNVIAQCLYAFATFTILGWMPALLMRSYNIDTQQAGMINGLISLVVIIGAPLGGFLSDRWQKKKNGGRAYFLAVAMLAMTITALLLILSTQYPLSVYITMGIIMNFCAALVLPGLFAIWTDVISPRNRTIGVGLGTMISLLAAVPGPLFLGSVSDALGGGAAGLRNAFLMLTPVLLLSTIMYFVMCRYYVADSANITDDVYAE